MNADALFFTAGHHGEALAALASEHLQSDPATAFMFADRLCRVRKPGARDLLMRAEASRRMGRLAFALADLAEAAQIDPTDPLVDRCLLKWGRDDDRKAAAWRVLQPRRSDPDLTSVALSVLGTGGCTVVPCVEATPAGTIVGWVAWQRPGVLSIDIHSGARTRRVHIEADAVHPLSEGLRAAADLSLSASAGPIEHLSFSLNGNLAAELSLDGPAGVAPAALVRPRRTAADRADITVILPVFADYAATAACLETLASQHTAVPLQVIAIDDAAPDPRLRSHLEKIAERYGFMLLRNECNRGFVASVNSALAYCAHGDVVLLNADTLLPAGALDRLRAAAHSCEGIGTVTPLSNNGEFTSFPCRNVVNPLGSLDEVQTIDAVAARVNRSRVVDMPNGIGFCLYVTRPCLDAVGSLSMIYERGYCEDSDFCLRARERGFRNVCATDVFVGHAGTRSFGAAKRALVVGNLGKLEQRFPLYRLECAAFLQADPLRASRGDIERSLYPVGPVRLLVLGAALPRSIADERVRQLVLSEDDLQTLIVTMTFGSGAVELRNAESSLPQSLRFDLDRQSENEALDEYLRHLDVRAIEIADAGTIVEQVRDRLRRISVGVSLLCGDLGWFRDISVAEGRDCRDANGSRPCRDCAASAFAIPDQRADLVARLQRRRSAMKESEAIVPLDRMSNAFALHLFNDRIMPVVTRQPARGAARTVRADLATTIGVIVPAPAAKVDRLVRTVARRLLSHRPEARLVVFGCAVDDLRVMASGNVFVTGAIDDRDCDRLLDQYRVGALFLPYRTGFFWLVDRLAERAALPMAYFDWSFGRLERDPVDLAIDPRLCDDACAGLVMGWCLPAGPRTDR